MGHNKKIFEKNLRVKPPHPPQKNTQQYVTNIFPKNIWWNWGPLFIAQCWKYWYNTAGWLYRLILQILLERMIPKYLFDFLFLEFLKPIG